MSGYNPFGGSNVPSVTAPTGNPLGTQSPWAQTNALPDPNKTSNPMSLFGGAGTPSPWATSVAPLPTMGGAPLQLPMYGTGVGAYGGGNPLPPLQQPSRPASPPAMRPASPPPALVRPASPPVMRPASPPVMRPASPPVMRPASPPPALVRPASPPPALVRPASPPAMRPASPPALGGYGIPTIPPVMGGGGVAPPFDMAAILNQLAIASVTSPPRQRKGKKQQESSDEESAAEEEAMLTGAVLPSVIRAKRGKWKNFIKYDQDKAKPESVVALYGKLPGDPQYNPNDPYGDDVPKANQYMHYREIRDIISGVYDPQSRQWIKPARRFAFSASGTGVGKTFIAGRLYQVLRNGKRDDGVSPAIQHMLVIGPVSAEATWAEFVETYNLPNVYFISYGALASQKDSQPKHPFLVRRDVETGTGNQKNFDITADFVQLCNNGVLIVFDEAHRVKTKTSAMSLACSKLSSHALRSQGYSRVLFLTATPFEKKKQALAFFKAFGMYTSQKLYAVDPIDKTQNWRDNGIGELFKKCAEIDLQAARGVANKYDRFNDLTKKKAEDIVYDFYSDVIRPNTVRSIEKPKLRPELEPVKRNLFLRLTPQEAAQYVHATEQVQLMGADVNGKKTGIIPAQYLVAVERAKVQAVIRTARWFLNTYPHYKVIIYQNYVNDKNGVKGNLQAIIDAFADVGKVVYKGGVEKEKRRALLESFNRDDNVRMFIGSTASGKESLSLHDLQGGRNRVMLISPSFHFIDSIQAAGRADRRGMLSKPYVLFTYGTGPDGQPHGLELKYLTSAYQKSLVMEGTIQGDVADDIVLPKDYGVWVETDSADPNQRFANQPPMVVNV